ncbi:MAG: N-acetylmuramoyl-L-alanine amidase [Xanthobacteraceae bacterium]
MRSATFPAASSVVAEVVPSPNHGERKDGRRPDMILLHYTGMQHSNAALALLTRNGSEVSAHYFVFEDGRVVQTVEESRRAWHAGASSWAGETDINSCSIGIEIANPGHDYAYPDFPARQIAAVTALCRGILTRHTIPPERVLAHSDVAPSRKQDPGEKFPWRTLHDSGVGHWVKPAPLTEEGHMLSPGDRGNEVVALQTSLQEYGYGIAANGIFDNATREVVTAFQRHFRPQRVDGICDGSTRKTLQDLLAHRGRPRSIAARARAFVAS